MPLTELIIDGFKSFADKTTIHFGKGITGIVGPNGSGKSNITEAIRWAMGETSAKSLRGNNMKDVIFAGSEFRKPLNSAQVTLVFDNKNRQLHFDNDKVAITRKILRSGDSEYLINEQSVRLKDVRSLFLDSGISQNSLAIISQGRVDQILNSRPEDRRDLFEEAAGVLHFKEQKEEAAAQLDKTNENLIRINDLVKELANRIEPLQEQSSLAKQYQYQKRGLDQKLKSLLAFEIQNLNEEKEKIQKQADQNQSLLSKLDREVKESQTAVADKRNDSKDLQTQRDQVQENLLKLTRQLSEINTNLQVAEQSKQFNDATKKEYQSQVTDLKQQIATLKTGLSELQKQEEQLRKQGNKLKLARQTLTEQLKENPADLNKKLEKKRNDYIQLLQDQTSNNNQIVYLETEIKRAQEDNSYNNNNVEAELKSAQTRLENQRKAGQTLTKNCHELKEQLDHLNKQKADLLAQENRLDEDVNQARIKLQQNTARKDALTNIQKRHEGYYYGVRNVLNHLNDYPGVIGAVGELLSFPQELEAAMTTALGGGVQDLITQSKNAARAAINTLKRQHAGRATFLPLDGLRQFSIPSSTVTTLHSFSGFKGIASDLVNNNSQIDITPAIRYLLGSVIIVDTIETATAVSNRLGRYRIVTLDGDIISPGGSMTGGTRNRRNNSPLQVTAEINSLQRKIAKLKAKYQETQQNLTDLSEKDGQLSKQVDNQRRKYQQKTQELNEAALSFQSQEKEVKRLQDAKKLFVSRVKEHDDRLTKMQDDLTNAKQQQQQLTKKAKLAQDQMNQIKTALSDFTAASQKIQSRLSELDPKIAVYRNKLENLANQKKDKQTDLQEAQQQLTTITDKLAALTKNHELSDQKKSTLKKQYEQINKDKTQLQQKLNNLSSRLGQYDAQISQLDQVASRNYDLRKDAAEEQEAYSIKITKYNSSINQRLAQLSEDYSLTYEAALAQAKGENTEDNRAALKKSVKLHQMSIDDIGPVNLDSIEEYENVKKRYDFLNGQQNDLLNAREDLQESMAELDKEVRDRFSQTFAKISVSFTKIFPIVFGGGNAKLVLTNPDDMLKTGIEIVAQPPGKKLQRLSLLSGGERALTAITLLFAMLEVNPVPFCVLDEVEAALDDANVTRFARFLQKYDMHTQFIVITHRRGTMQEADQLFGVVMQELGVSKVVSVSLKDIKDEVN